MSKWRRGEKHGTKRKNQISEQFVYYTREMISSPAYMALSLQGRKVLRRLELEHMAHGGQDNGKLPCRYHDFVKYGCRKNGLSAALIEVGVLGFAPTMSLGTRAFGNIPGKASTFRLTYLHIRRTDWISMTNELEAYKTATVPDAAATAGYRTPRQFVKAFEAAGFRVLTPSPRKHVVFVTDFAKFLNPKQSKGTPTP